MILGLGIDSIEIERFKKWHTYAQKKLRRFFSQQEIDYCVSIPEKSAERFAVRFAAKEAFFKALGQAYPENQLNLLKLARGCQVLKAHNLPYLEIDWTELKLPALKALISLTHTRICASAIIILQEL